MKPYGLVGNRLDASDRWLIWDTHKKSARQQARREVDIHRDDETHAQIAREAASAYREMIRERIDSGFAPLPAELEEMVDPCLLLSLEAA